MSFADKKITDAAGKKRQSSVLIKSIVVIIVALCSLATATYAWISLNKQAESDQAKMAVDYDRFFVEAEYYKYNVKEQEVETSSDLTGIEFNQYDLVFRSRNRYTPIVAAIRMTGEDLPESGSINVLIERDPSASGSYIDAGGKNRMSLIFSNIMRVTAMVGAGYYNSDPNVLFANVDTDTNYETLRTRTGSTALSKVFTTVTTTGTNPSLLTDVTNSNVEFVVDYTADDFVEINGENTLIVYLYFMYDEGFDAATYKYNGLLGIFQEHSEWLGSIALGDLSKTSIKFDNDLISIKVSHS